MQFTVVEEIALPYRFKATGWYWRSFYADGSYSCWQGPYKSEVGAKNVARLENKRMPRFVRVELVERREEQVPFHVNPDIGPY